MSIALLSAGSVSSLTRLLFRTACLATLSLIGTSLALSATLEHIKSRG